MAFVIPASKIAGYLLTNPRKSGFFLRFGYDAENWMILRDDILTLTKTAPLTFVRKTPFGDKFQLRGEMLTPSGRAIKITTIWMILKDNPSNHNFLTAYPTKNLRSDSVAYANKKRRAF